MHLCNWSLLLMCFIVYDCILIIKYELYLHVKHTPMQM